MQKSQVKKLLLCTLLLLAIVPAVISTLPNFQARAAAVGPGGSHNSNGGHGGKNDDPHTKNLDSNQTMTSSTTSWATSP